jgi:hypothetical protein
MSRSPVSILSSNKAADCSEREKDKQKYVSVVVRIINLKKIHIFGSGIKATDWIPAVNSIQTGTIVTI